MNFYIETENGAVKNHPAFEHNLIEAFGSIPEHWEPFVRVERSALGVYKVVEADTPTYEKVNGVWTDVWFVRDMTLEEKTAKQELVRYVFNERAYASNWSAWTLDEATCEMVPPIPRPDADQTKIDAGIFTYWCGADNNWKDTPVRPEGEYKFDFLAWQWVEITL
jgi:hypothetical protein